MNTETPLQSLLARLINGVYIAKSILETAMLMYRPDGIVNRLEDRYEALNDILKLDLAENGFLDKTVIVDRLPQLRASEPHIVAMVSIINLGLATFKLFSETDLDQVLKSLFTAIVPVDTDILQRIVSAYTQLLHKVAFNKATAYNGDLATLLSEIKPTQLDWLEMYHIELTRSENQCLSRLADEMAPMEQGEFTMLWECALNSMIRQSRIIRDVILKIPNELIEASGQPNATGPETTIGESIPENHTLTAVADTIDATTVATANDGNDVADTIENAGGAYVLHDNDDDSDDIFYDASTNIIMGENEVTSDEAQPETPNISESPSFPSKNRDLDAIATTTGDGDVADTIATTDGDDGVADTIDNTSDDVYAFQDHGGVYVLHDDDSDSNDILYDASDNTDSTMAENEVTPNDAQPETPNISESPSSPSKKRNLDAIDDESDSTSDDSKVAKKAKIMEDTVPPDDMEIDGPTVSDSTNNQQTPQLSPQLPSPSISPAIHNQEPETPTVSPTRSPTRTVEEYMESGIPNPYISNRNRYKTSRLEPRSYTRRSMQRRF